MDAHPFPNPFYHNAVFFRVWQASAHSRQSGILIPAIYMGSHVYSRQSGMLMHLGPPRPRESSAEGIS